MPTPDGDQFKLYHGTAGKIEGGELRPSMYGVHGPGVYSTDKVKKAEGYARGAAETSDIDKRTGKPDGKTMRPLFGTVYEIETKGAEVMRYHDTGDTYLTPTERRFLPPKPPKVKNAVSFPLPEYSREQW